MKRRTAATLGATALLLVTTGLVGQALMTGGVAFAGPASSGEASKAAAASAAKARKMLADGTALLAVAHAEAAVQAAPQNQAYRALLGQVYLMSGRFASARDAFSDALALSPNDGRSALSLALAQIANGDWTGARQTLDAHADTIAVADRGLAIALAGDPAMAVDVLTVAARTAGADAKTRQNLALSLALAGRWREARAIAEVDVAADELDKRMVDWAVFARPVGAADQVASLLKVIPVEDKGQPVALALNARVAAQLALMATPAPFPDAPGLAAADLAADAPKLVEATVLAPAPAIVFAERREVVQALPARSVKPRPAARVAKPAAAPAPVLAAKPATPVPVAAKPMPVAAKPVAATARAAGNFYLQLGAFENAAIARDGWVRATRRYPAFAGQNPTGMAFKTATGSVYRLSVGGFTRADAVAMCSAYRARGGQCFVREGAGDQAASWLASAKQPVRQLASR
ncbi:MAG: sporulation protein [Sphingomonas sp.]|nr:sporulation protein [Sphingomonas sp.]